MQIETQDIGVMGTGSNMFRCGLVHSSGAVFLGTYGPPPGIVWKYDPTSQALTKIGAPGEYQLDCMVEAPDGKIYIGTAYNGLVYELNPDTGAIRSLGSPPVDSTPWIFTMIRTREGEIFGAKGVGLFRLDWKTGELQSCGVVPGEHVSSGLSSAPIVRTLEERPDGILWGDTNRWIFTFDPQSSKTELIADVAARDEASYGIVHGFAPAPVQDLYFQIYARFSGKTPQHKFNVCRAATGEIKPLLIEGLDESNFHWANGWWQDEGTHGQSTPHWLVSCHDEETSQSHLAFVDVENQKVVECWEVEGSGTPPQRIAGPGLWFISARHLYQADPVQKRVKIMVTNPVPAQCRCLAASPDGRLATDTYDCGFVFTGELGSNKRLDHGRVWMDDHRSNYGPAVFAGTESEYFLANHGEDESVASLWVTHLTTNRHWRIGAAAVQLVRLRDGSVWGTHGPNPPIIHFDSSKCWTPAWQAQPGALFRYQPGANEVEIMNDAGLVGPLTEAPGENGKIFLCIGNTLRLYDIAVERVLDERDLPDSIIAAATDLKRSVAYFVCESGALFSAHCEGGTIAIEPCDHTFGETGRGCFVLPQSGRLVGIGEDGIVSVFDPQSGTVEKASGPQPLFAGPAVDPSEDAWYFAHLQVTKYSIA